MSIVDKSQSGRACAEPASRPSAPRSGGGAKRRALTSVSTRARCWLDDAASDHNILRSTPSPVSVSSSRSATCRLTTATSTSVRMTRCRRSRRRCGSWRCATGTVRPKRQRPRLPGSGVPGLPDRREWPVWTAAQMRAADEYLQEAGAAMTESGAARRQQRVSAGP